MQNEKSKVWILSVESAERKHTLENTPNEKDTSASKKAAVIKAKGEKDERNKKRNGNKNKT